MRHVAHPRDLGVKRVKRMQRTAVLRRGEQRSDEAIMVGRTNKLGAIGERVLHSAELSSIGA